MSHTKRGGRAAKIDLLSIRGVKERLGKERAECVVNNEGSYLLTIKRWMNNNSFVSLLSFEFKFDSD